jgi:hypothetical protein
MLMVIVEAMQSQTLEQLTPTAGQLKVKASDLQIANQIGVMSKTRYLF